MFSMVSASLGTFKSGNNVSIRILANCTSIDLTEVTSPTEHFIINTPMTLLGGQTFGYNFTNTEISGKYSYSWNNPCIDCSQGDCGNSFEITPSGFEKNTAFYIIILILTIGIIAFGYAVEDPWLVILGSFGMILFGLYVLFFGIVGVKDVTYTWGIGIITLMVGAYFGVRASLEQIE